MRRFLVDIPAATLAAILVAATLGACGGGARSGGEAAGGPTSTSPTEAAPAPDAGAPTAAPDEEPAASPEPAPAPPAPAPAPEDGSDTYLCPEGGIAEVTALQDAVDQGHQPWRLSASAVAVACTFGGAATAEPAGPTSYRVTSTSTGEVALVELAQPLGPGGIWVVTAVAPVT